MTDKESTDEKPEWTTPNGTSRDTTVSDEDGTSDSEEYFEWDAWNPCPECGSTTLKQILRETLSIEVSEDGQIVNEEQHEAFAEQYVECVDCGEVLLDEIQ